jgi:hypothetical protein
MLTDKQKVEIQVQGKGNYCKFRYPTDESSNCK